MDLQLPNENEMELMRREFAKLGIHNAATTLSANEGGHFVFLLYFALRLRYNILYGNKIFDSKGNLGRLRRARPAFEELNDL